MGVHCSGTSLYSDVTQICERNQPNQKKQRNRWKEKKGTTKIASVKLVMPGTLRLNMLC